MFGITWVPNLSFIRPRQPDNRRQKKQMSAVIRVGKTDVSDQSSFLEDEIQWLTTQDNSETKNYKAVLINPDEKAEKSVISQTSEPYLIFTIDAASFTENPDQQNGSDSAPHQQEFPDSQICLACSAEQNSGQQSITSPPYTFYDKATNSHYGMIIDLEPDDIDRLFRHSDFVEWLGVYKPNLLFSRDFNNSEYLFYWLIYHIIKADNKVTEGLHNGLSSWIPQSLGGLFNIFFTDGTGVYTYSNKVETNSGSKTVFFRIRRDGNSVYSYILRNSEDKLDFDWIHLQPNSLYYFPISGELRYYLFLNSLGNIEVRPSKSKQLGLHFLF